MASVLTIREILQKSEKFLADRGVDSPRLSAQVLAAHSLGMSRMDMILDSDRPLAAAEVDRIRELIVRRGKGEPVAYILGEQEFYGMDFRVTPDTLIPRPETELIIEEALKLFPREYPLRFADFGTGSGILAVTISTLFPNSRCAAIDISPGALAVAGKNAARHGVADRIGFVHGSFADRHLEDASCDLIVSNPPYVTEGEYAELSHEVAGFEPKTALVPGPEGLELVRALAPRAHAALKPGGSLLVEIGWKQGQGCREIFSSDAGWSDTRILRDLAGHERIVTTVKS